ncbi:plasma membrane channel protein Ist2 [Blumeria hordei DH14]|uniref:Plasma membrane channel protein Ist2 n=1 Tax=Blumeria graminis f. sp. hordei (strain DH14) TaxID=546991 RepID=N1JQG9_BLUG1|nr:plasma membrane channel protein Ist2 [Blumeria hordei DH14]
MAANIADLSLNRAANFNVDFVLSFDHECLSKTQAEATLMKLVSTLAGVGLATQVRNGDVNTIFLLVKVATTIQLHEKIYRSRLRDWLYGVSTSPPPKEMQKNLREHPITEAERLRLVYSLIIGPKKEGGAAITPRCGEWENVHSIFRLHDQAYNRLWIKRLSSKYFLTSDDLSEIKGRFGEKIAFYFAFLQSYFLFLIFPAAFGFFAWLFIGPYSPTYAILNAFWCICFVEYWKKQQKNLATQWEVNGISRIHQQRSEFKHESVLNDPITGENINVYSPIKRLFRQLLQIPFVIAATVTLGSMIAFGFAIEIFLSEIYNGPFKGYLVNIINKLILAVVMPTLSALLKKFASKLTDLENYETLETHESSMIYKDFVLNFITSYLPIFLTAFVYVPFAQDLAPRLDVFRPAVRYFIRQDEDMVSLKSEFKIDPDRLKKQIIYFTVTAQVVDFAFEVIVPYLKRKIFSKVKEVQAEKLSKSSSRHSVLPDQPYESEFLSRVRNEANLDPYDVTTDFREMIIQFGYLSLFSVIWPITAMSFLINNWIEIRGDALKMTQETQSPMPWQADSIGPWLDALVFLAWLGSLVSPALIYLFSGEGLSIEDSSWYSKGCIFLLTIFVSEHIYLAVQFGIRKALRKTDNQRLQEEKSQKFIMRKNYLIEMLGAQTTEKALVYNYGSNETRIPGLKDSLRDIPKEKMTSEDKFWQLDLAATIEVVKTYIHKVLLVKVFVS